MNKFRIFAYPYGVWMGLFVVIPMIMVVYFSLTTTDGQFSMDNFANLTSYATVFFRSFRLAISSTVICLILGYPMAYLMSCLPDGRQNICMMLIMLPMWMNFLLRTYAWLTILENNGLLNRLLEVLNLPPISIINTSAAVGLGMVYNYLPFMILPIYTSLMKLDKALLEAARDLGCNDREVFTKVIFPLSIPGVVSGVTMVFVPAVSTFVISKILGGGANMLVGDLIELQFVGGAYNPNLGAAISLVMMLVILAFMAVTKGFDDEEGRTLV